jgi:hypothetical protein
MFTVCWAVWNDGWKQAGLQDAAAEDLAAICLQCVRVPARILPGTVFALCMLHQPLMPEKAVDLPMGAESRAMRPPVPVLLFCTVAALTMQ